MGIQTTLRLQAEFVIVVKQWLSGYSIKMNSLQDRLRVELNRRGRGAISALARYVGVRPQTARTWVKEGVTPREDHIFKIAAFLGVSPHWLHYGESKDVPAPLPPPRAKPVLEYLVEDEHALIQEYRRSTEDGKNQILLASRAAEKLSIDQVLRNASND